jgi:RHS repeat-associated protein
LTDFVGAIVELYSFDAYGNAIGFDPSVALTEFLYSSEQFDSKIGQQYLRARYYDPATGRFNRLDPFFGNLNDPQSLHKYLYTHADPVNGIDPSGAFFDFFSPMGSSEFGYMVEAVIDEQYLLTHMGERIDFGKAARLGSKPEPSIKGSTYYAKPDILNRDRKTYNEINPFSASGIEAGIAQMKLRAIQFAPYGYLPDLVWEPPIQPIAVGVLLIFVNNIDGVLYYSEVDCRVLVTMLALPKLTAGASMEASMINRAMTVFKASGAERTILNVLPKTIKMAADGKKIDHTRAKAHLAIAASFAVPICAISTVAF